METEIGETLPLVGVHLRIEEDLMQFMSIPDQLKLYLTEFVQVHRPTIVYIACGPLSPDIRDLVVKSMNTVWGERFWIMKEQFLPKDINLAIDEFALIEV